MRRILPAIIIAILFHVALFALDPGLLTTKPGMMQKPAITVTMSYKKKPAPQAPVKKPPEIKKKKNITVVEKVTEPAPVKEKKPVPEPEAIRKQEIVEEKIENKEEFFEQASVELEDAEQAESLNEEAVLIVETEAMPLYSMNPEPRYPKMAKKRGYEGTVLLSVHVNKEGKVDDLWLFESSGYKILDNAALKAVKDWTFEPGRRGDKPVEMWVEVPVKFELR